jgi:peptidyl-prolyl cis-trans isomerase C
MSLPKSRRSRTALTAVLVGLALFGGGGYYWVASTTLPDNAAFAVGNRIVTKKQLDARIKTLHALYGVNPPARDPAKFNAFRRDAAKAQAVTMVLQDEAAKRGIAIPDNTVQNTLDQYLAQQLGPGPDARAAFTRILGNAGTNEHAVLDEIKQQLSVNKMFSDVTRDVKVSDADLEKSFPKYANQLGVPERRGLANIVVSSQQSADDVMNKLRSGADFGDLAKQYSIDGSTRDKGGDLGMVSADQLEGQYAKAAFSASPGQLVGPVQNKNGWNIGKVISVQPGKPANFADVKEQLRTRVDFDMRMGKWNQWLTGAMHNADIRYADDYRPANPASVPTSSRPGEAAGSGGSPGGGR